MAPRILINLSLAFWACWFSAISAAQNDPHIGELSTYDRQFMTEQRNLLQDLTSTKLGRQFGNGLERDLDLLQTLLDQGLVRPEQTRELQAMGVIMGDHLAADLGLHWVIYEDRAGRSRALRYKESDDYLFPMTMISRRREAGNMTPVADIYHKAHDIMEAAIPALPFE